MITVTARHINSKEPLTSKVTAVTSEGRSSELHSRYSLTTHILADLRRYFPKELKAGYRMEHEYAPDVVDKLDFQKFQIRGTAEIDFADGDEEEMPYIQLLFGELDCWHERGAFGRRDKNMSSLTEEALDRIFEMTGYRLNLGDLDTSIKLTDCSTGKEQKIELDKFTKLWDSTSNPERLEIIKTERIEAIQLLNT